MIKTSPKKSLLSAASGSSITRSVGLRSGAHFACAQCSHELLRAEVRGQNHHTIASLTDKVDHTV